MVCLSTYANPDTKLDLSYVVFNNHSFNILTVNNVLYLAKEINVSIG